MNEQATEAFRFGHHDDWAAIFAHITSSMNGFRIRSIGMMRARSNIGLIDLAYNIVRSVYLQGA